MSLRERLDALRAEAHRAIDRMPGKAGELARKANAAFGRPLADAAELADRRAFEARATPAGAAPGATAPREAAPVVVYHMDKTRRDAARLTEVLEGAGIPYKVMNIQDDPAAQSAVRRDSKGFRLPVVFIAGEAIGGRAELTNLAASGELKKKVFG
ncbi:MAG TPA: glutaredoxin domain-containing protein [Kofleriaceae bacterium]|jgi:glutaredoxin|nr:glutaredoxin domain-containing protein [Kofleriaceae bacterium]